MDPVKLKACQDAEAAAAAPTGVDPQTGLPITPIADPTSSPTATPTP